MNDNVNMNALFFQIAALGGTPEGRDKLRHAEVLMVELEGKAKQSLDTSYSLYKMAADRYNNIKRMHRLALKCMAPTLKSEVVRLRDPETHEIGWPR